ncbi:Asp-tRNA(Asn)/Glu-tRNA(Gln) amidotransferase subunit GatC [Candidatus Roizmanbacteria bacterium]|nr:Asp-tRNA(Asn)/Glu-tRNA(Gln) amidotransferase subunit GatC [Candidatus Roizmanbacteria bacterium]
MAKRITLTRDEIIHLAKLADLNLTEEEIKKYQQELSQTLDYIANLDELDTSAVEPTSQTTNDKDVFFQDGAKNDRLFSQEKATANAKNKKNNYFAVNRIL